MLDACVTSSLTYGCETWAGYIPKDVEVLYRSGIKTAMAIRQNTNNEIVYVESNLYPLERNIEVRQLKLWKQINDESSRDTLLGKLITQAKEINIEYVNYYIQLEQQYNTPSNCQRIISREYQSTWRENILKAHNDDINSKLGAYFLVNQNIKNPNLLYSKNIFEIERILITRFRTGSHGLLIETGRYHNPRRPRDQRMCSCKEEIQTVHHILIKCKLLQHLRVIELDTVEKYFEWDGIYNFLLHASKVLKIEC